MDSTPKISIIVPVYNTEPYLRECLDSILSQTLTDIEIIIINDGSPDNSMDIIREYEKKDSRIVVIDKQNEGVGKARNDGLDRATGEFVAFLDSDDYYSSATALESLYLHAKENNVAIVAGQNQSLTEQGELVDNGAVIEEFGLTFDKRSKKYFDFQYDYGFQSYIYDRKLIGNIRFPSHSRFEDPPFFVHVMAKGEYFGYVDKPIFVYRSVSSPLKYSVQKTLDMMKGLMDNLIFSRKNGLSKLHYLTAQRLKHEASYMITKNLDSERYEELLSAYIKTLGMIDFDWLKSEDYEIKEPFVPEVFSYMREVTMKYGKLRRYRLLRLASKLKR